jgi:hypothetical protein
VKLDKIVVVSFHVLSAIQPGKVNKNKKIKCEGNAHIATLSRQIMESASIFQSSDVRLTHSDHIYPAGTKEHRCPVQPVWLN